MARPRLARVALIGWLLWRLLGPETPPRFKGVQQRPGTLPARLVVSGRHEFLVRELGEPEAPPLLLIHGWVYDSLATWHRLMPILAESHRVIAVDLRGHGKSDRVRGRYDISEVADEVAELLSTLGVGAASVIGYSMGGMVAQALVRRHRGRVERLVLAATAAHPVGWPRWVTVPAFIVGRTIARIDRFVAPRIGYRYLTSRGVIPPEHGAWLWEALLDRDVDLYYEAGFAILRFDGRSWAADIDAPTLCIVPTEDQLIPASRQLDTARLIPGADLLEIPGARHEAVLTHSGEMAAAIIDFLA